MEKIYKKDDNLIIEIPLSADRYNPYSKSIVGKMDNIVGVICGDEIGFANWIDMDYKGKPDQISEIFYQYGGEEEDFIKLCKELDIKVEKYPLCDYCQQPIFGAFTFGDKGKKCFECSDKIKQ